MILIRDVSIGSTPYCMLLCDINNVYYVVKAPLRLLIIKYSTRDEVDRQRQHEMKPIAVFATRSQSLMLYFITYWFCMGGLPG